MSEEIIATLDNYEIANYITVNNSYSIYKFCKLVIYVNTTNYKKNIVYDAWAKDETEEDYMNLINDGFAEFYKDEYVDYLSVTHIVDEYCNYYYKHPEEINETRLDLMVAVFKLEVDDGFSKFRSNDLDNIVLILSIKKFYNDEKTAKTLREIGVSGDVYNKITPEYYDFLKKYKTSNMLDMFTSIKPVMDVCDAFMNYLSTLENISKDLPDQDIIISRDFLSHIYEMPGYASFA